MKGFASSLTSAALRLCHPYFFCLLFALGIVLIHVSVQADGLNPQDKNFLLFGESALPSFGCILIFVASLGTALYALRRQGVDRVALILFTIAAFVSMHFFHNSANTIYTNDWTYHLAHTEFINTHWLEPYGYLGKQDHHPPLYFYAAAVMIWFAQALGTVPGALGAAVFIVAILSGIQRLRLAYRAPRRAAGQGLSRVCGAFPVVAGGLSPGFQNQQRAFLLCQLRDCILLYPRLVSGTGAWGFHQGAVACRRCLYGPEAMLSSCLEL